MSMKNCFVALCVPVWVILIAAPAQASDLVREGKPVATIVIAQEALEPEPGDLRSSKVAAAANEFRDHVQKMSGAELLLVGDDSEPEGYLVLIGRSRLADEMAGDIPAGLSPERVEEGFVILAKGDRLLLAGNDEGNYHGTEYAVAEMLERLGVRWFMPGEFGEYVPQRTTISILDLEIRQTPDFRMRNWWVNTTPEMAQQERRWKIRNKMNPDEIWAVPTDSSIRDFVADQKLVDSQPDLFARNADGAPNPHLPNLSSPEAVKIVADKMIALFRADPHLHSIGIAPDDGVPRDFSPDTLRRHQGFSAQVAGSTRSTETSVTEEWLEFVNAIAREVRKELPDRIITTNGYANRDTPPQGVAIESNVAIMFAAIWADTLHAIDDPKSWQAVRHGQMLQRWSELTDKVWVYGYNHTMLVSALTPVPLTRKLARDIPLMKRWGIAGFGDEARNHWAESGITTKYLRARLEWDADADVEAVLSDFFQHWYGDAAEPARRFWDALEDAVSSTPLLGHEDRILPYVYSPDLMVQLATNLEAAEVLAGDPRSRQHVQVDRLIYEHLRAYLAMSAAEFAGDWSLAAAQADSMMVLRTRLMDISPFFLLDHENGIESGIWYWGVTERADYYRKLVDLTGGGSGELVALLSEEARFTIDPYDEGRHAGWYKADWDTAGWRRIRTTEPFYAQGYLAPNGYPYLGSIWYRFEVDIPADFGGQQVRLLAPVVETEAWLWVNGEYLGHRRYQEAYVRPNELEMDVTSVLRPGQKNVVTLLASTGTAAAQAAGGLGSRIILYSPDRMRPDF